MAVKAQNYLKIGAPWRLVFLLHVAWVTNQHFSETLTWQVGREYSLLVTPEGILGSTLNACSPALCSVSLWYSETQLWFKSRLSHLASCVIVGKGFNLPGPLFSPLWAGGNRMYLSGFQWGLFKIWRGKFLVQCLAPKKRGWFFPWLDLPAVYATRFQSPVGGSGFCTSEVTKEALPICMD